MLNVTKISFFSASNRTVQQILEEINKDIRKQHITCMGYHEIVVIKGMQQHCLTSHLDRPGDQFRQKYNINQFKKGGGESKATEIHQNYCMQTYPHVTPFLNHQIRKY